VNGGHVISSLLVLFLHQVNELIFLLCLHLCADLCSICLLHIGEDLAVSIEVRFKVNFSMLEDIELELMSSLFDKLFSCFLLKNGLSQLLFDNVVVIVFIE
jgi:hypothetical protein